MLVFLTFHKENFITLSTFLWFELFCYYVPGTGTGEYEKASLERASGIEEDLTQGRKVGIKSSVDKS